MLSVSAGPVKDGRMSTRNGVDVLQFYYAQPVSVSFCQIFFPCVSTWDVDRKAVFSPWKTYGQKGIIPGKAVFMGILREQGDTGSVNMACCFPACPQMCILWTSQGGHADEHNDKGRNDRVSAGDEPPP